MSEKAGRVSRGSLHDSFGGFDGLGGSGEHLALLSLVLQITATVTVLLVSAVISARS